MRTLHNIQEGAIVEDMGRNFPRMYVALEGRQEEKIPYD